MDQPTSHTHPHQTDHVFKINCSKCQKKAKKLLTALHGEHYVKIDGEGDRVTIKSTANPNKLMDAFGLPQLTDNQRPYQMEGLGHSNSRKGKLVNNNGMDIGMGDPIYSSRSYANFEPSYYGPNRVHYGVPYSCIGPIHDRGSVPYCEPNYYTQNWRKHRLRSILDYGPQAHVDNQNATQTDVVCSDISKCKLM